MIDKGRWSFSVLAACAYYVRERDLDIELEALSRGLSYTAPPNLSTKFGRSLKSHKCGAPSGIVMAIVSLTDPWTKSSQG